MKDFKVYQASGYLTKLVTDASDVRKEYEEISGSLVQFNTLISAPLESLIVDINPIQDLHGQDAPYPAGGGVNKLQVTIPVGTTTVAGIQVTVSDNGEITLNGTSTEILYITLNEPFDSTKFAGMYFKSNFYVGGVNYYVTPSNSNTVLQDLLYTGDTIADNGSDRRLRLKIPNGITISNQKVLPRIGATSSDVAEYHPYSNICPITGWTGCEVNVDGANLFDDSNYLESIYISANEVGSHNSYNLFFTPCSKNTTYTFARETTDGYPVFGLCDEYPSIGTDVYEVTNMRSTAKKTFSTGNHSYILYAKYKTDTGKFSLALGNDEISVDTPFTGTTYSVTFPDTVYGGKYNFVDGKGDNNLAEVDLGTISWYAHASVANVFVGYGDNLPRWKMIPSSGTASAICSKYKLTTSAIGGVDVIDCSIAMGTDSSTRIYVHDSTVDNITEFRTAISGVQLVYELATPVEYSITPEEINTLIGVNNIWADTGDVSVKYRTH